MRSGRFSSQLNGRAEVNRQRNRKGATREFLGEFLGLNPGSTGPQIIAAGADRNLAASSIYRDLKTWRRIHRTANGRYWLDKIGDPELAVAAEVEHAFEIVKSSRLSDATKVEVLVQLSKTASRAPPVTRAVLELIGLPKLSRRVRSAMLPFVHIAIRAAFQPQESRSATSGIPRPRYAARLLESTLRLLDAFLDDQGGDGTIAWNTLYAIVTSPDAPHDLDLMGIAKRAIAIEVKGGLPSPSPVKAFLRKLAENERVGPAMKRELLRRVTMARGTSRERIRNLFEALDLGQLPRRSLSTPNPDLPPGP